VFLFQKIKLKLKCRHFESLEEIQDQPHDVMKMLTQIYFHQWLHSWKSRWEAQIDIFREFLCSTSYLNPAINVLLHSQLHTASPYTIQEGGLFINCGEVKLTKLHFCPKGLKSKKRKVKLSP
jgi:hypothetical protein